jgi:hypothetical protein
MYILTIVVVVVAIMLLSPILRGSLSDFSLKAKYAILLFVLLVSLLANIGVAGRYVFFECLIHAGRLSEKSPDGKWVAKAESIQPMLQSLGPAHYLLKIESAKGQVVKSVRVDAHDTLGAGAFRGLSQAIRWSSDSSEVAFEIPGIQVRMDREYRATQP